MLELGTFILEEEIETPPNAFARLTARYDQMPPTEFDTRLHKSVLDDGTYLLMGVHGLALQQNSSRMHNEVTSPEGKKTRFCIDYSGRLVAISLPPRHLTIGNAEIQVASDDLGQVGIAGLIDVEDDGSAGSALADWIDTLSQPGFYYVDPPIPFINNFAVFWCFMLKFLPDLKKQNLLCQSHSLLNPMNELS